LSGAVVDTHVASNFFGSGYSASFVVTLAGFAIDLACFDDFSAAIAVIMHRVCRYEFLFTHSRLLSHCKIVKEQRGLFWLTPANLITPRFLLSIYNKHHLKLCQAWFKACLLFPFL
jgi:hypothetical protein